MKTSERKDWSKLVLNQMDDKQQKIKQVDFYPGIKYREHLIPALEQKRIGEQLNFYKTNTK